MLNKKSLFNVVYAIASGSAIMSCFGILNELLNIVQLFDMEITNTYKFSKDNFWIPVIFYSIMLAVCAFAVIMLLLYVWGKLKQTPLNVFIVISCIAVLAMSLIFIYYLRDFREAHTSSLGTYYPAYYRLDYFKYLTNYTFRSGALTFVGNMIIILVCNIIESRHNKKLRKLAQECEESAE